MVVGVKALVLGIPVTATGSAEEYEKAIEWYVQVLGCELLWKMGIASLRLPSGQTILLYGAEDDENSIWYTGDIGPNPHYSVHGRHREAERGIDRQRRSRRRHYTRWRRRQGHDVPRPFRQPVLGDRRSEITA